METNLEKCYIPDPGIYLQVSTSVNAAEPILTCQSSALLPCRWNDRQHIPVTVTTRDGRTRGLRADVLVLAGVLPHGVWWGPAVHSPVPQDSEERHQ